MSNSEFALNLSKLDGDYEILGELNHDAGSPVYLARHVGLNRDVTIAVVNSPSDHDAALTHLAADVRLLSGMRHPNIIPIIEGVWLDARTFAIVRARVRGSTLDQLIVRNGAVPIAEVATTIQRVHDTIEWARSQGIVHRRITPSSVMFQQGNGRVFFSFEPTPIAGSELPDECDDAATIGILASDMMLGRVTKGGQSVTAVSIPTPILPAVTRAIEAVRRCHPDNAHQVVTSLLKELHAAARIEAATAGLDDAPTVEVQPVKRVEPWREPARRAEVEEPVSVVPLPKHDAETIPVVESTFGFNARIGAAVAAAAIIGVLALFSFRHQSSTPNVGSLVVAADTHSQAAGDVVIGGGRVDSSANGSPGTQPSNRSSKTSIPSATKPNPLNSRVCRSPAAADQHKCLADAIDRNDAELNDIYQRLVTALRRRSNAAAVDRDPDSVVRLRASQRKWVDDRDAACRLVGSGRWYARERSSCFAQQSANRARELQRVLDGLPRDR